MNKIEKYEHHGYTVWVDKQLKGKHRDHCLCYKGCIKFRPGEQYHCPIAQELYEFDCKHSLTTPVWECPEYESLYRIQT